MDIQYNITYHAIERLQERFSTFTSQIPILQNWKREQGLNKIKPFFNDMLKLTEENRSYLNNSAYMINLYEKYGYDMEYCFLEFKEKNILFLLTKTRSAKQYMLVTLMPIEYRPGVKNLKYGDKEEKEKAINKLMDNWSKNNIVINIKTNTNTNTNTNKSLPHFKAIASNTQLVEDNNIKIQNIDTSIDLEKKILNDKLIASVRDGIAIPIKRFSNSKCMYFFTVNNQQYEFTYSKSNSGIKTIDIHNMTLLSSEENEKIQDGLRKLNSKAYLYKYLLKSINNNHAILLSEEADNRKLYKVQIYNKTYNVYYIENNNDEPTLLLKENKNIILKNPLDHETLKNSGIKLNETDSLYIKLISAINNQDFKIIEKYSITSSLRETTIENIDYQYVYIRRNNKEKDREIILQDNKKVANENNESYKINEVITNSSMRVKL